MARSSGRPAKRQLSASGIGYHGLTSRLFQAGHLGMNEVHLLTTPTCIDFAETAGESPKVSASLADWWKQFSIDKPSLFNGPVAACRHCELTPSGALRIDWYETDYAHYLQRVAVNPITTPARAIFCSVALRTASGSLLVGRMAGNTSSPNRLQLPEET